jgi:hypothetical protein
MQTPSNSYDVIIIGAGAAGLMCAAQAGYRGRKVLLLEKAEKIGKKILIAGGGRCNFTNLHTQASAYLSNNSHFCKSALSRFTPQDFLALMQTYGLSWTEKTLGQLFCDQKSKAIVNLLWQECQNAQVNLQLNSTVQKIQKSAQGFEVVSSEGLFNAAHVVIATGGPSIPKMGASDFALSIAKQFGISNIPFKPALVPLTLSPELLQGLLQGLAGISLEVMVRCGAMSFREGMLITHRGLSGPAILQISSYWQAGQAIEINLLPNLQVSTWLIALAQQRPRVELKTVLAEVLPSRLSQRLCESVFNNQALAQYSHKQLHQMGEQLNHWCIVPSGTEGMRTAEVSLGGVNTDELSSKTFETKKVAGLYFIGESVDVTGWLGGYNLQWAWASGWCAGQYV